MAATLAGFLAFRLAATVWIRPHLQPVYETRIPIADDKTYNFMRGDWILDRDVYDTAGNLVVSNGDVTCGPPPEVCYPEWGPDAYNLLVYQPADRFWRLPVPRNRVVRGRRRSSDRPRHLADPPPHH